MLEPPQGMRVGRFGPYEVNLTTGELRKHGIRLKLQDQPFQILVLLLARPGKLVTREEIRQRLWPSGTFVDFDNGLNTALSRLREALGDVAERPRYIETLARRGYRWMVPVDWMASRSTDLSGAVSVEATSEAKVTSNNLIGKKVSNYRILELLGAGGMGVVYKAEDLKLGRRVALKFLPQELVRNSLALDRFEREARAASTMNHPNICTIYEFEEYEGQPFIVMELLQGHTLRERIGNASAPLQTNEVIDLAIQITDGLDAAHQQGIIHRDIKPTNIFVTTRAVAKILDFGLAKVIPADSSAAVSQMSTAKAGELLTNPGTALGTIAYMSPEQVSGKELDSRTDLFSLGAVLYEMCTEKLPFPGETPGLIFHAILDRQPLPASQSNPAVSPEFEEIIKKALEKDRDMRYQSAADIRTDLQRLKRDTKGDSHTNVAIPRRTLSLPPWWRSKLVTAMGGLILVFTIIAVGFYRHRLSLAGSLGQRPVHTQITFLGNAHSPAISPDGKFIAYATYRPGSELKLMLQSLAGGPSLEIFHGRIFPGFRWSPDGSELAVITFNREAKADEVFVVSRLGGAPRLLAEGLFGSVCWSSDGSQIITAGSGIWSVNKLTGTRKQLPGPVYESVNDIDCSAKTGMLLLLTQTSEKYQIWTMKPDGTEQRKLIEERKEIGSVRWSPTGDAIYYFHTEGDAKDLVKLSVTGQSTESTVLEHGLNTTDLFTISPDGSQLAYTRDLNFSNLWLAELPAHGAYAKVQAKQVTAGTLVYDAPSISPDSRWVAFTSGSNTKSNIYKMSLDGGQPVQLTFFDAALTASPAWSPDGQRIAFSCDHKVWEVNADGSTTFSFDKAKGSETNFELAWFPRPEIVYLQPGLNNLLRLNVETQAEQLLLPASLAGVLDSKPIFSPDGKKFAIRWQRPDGIGLWVITPEKYSERFLSPNYHPFGWSPDGAYIYAHNPGGPEIVRIGLGDSKQPKSVISMPGFLSFTSSTISPDGRKIVSTVGEGQSDIWLMNDFDPQVGRTKR
jgi:serine/threonine protein kinase/Tol biopolymer transport system component